MFLARGARFTSDGSLPNPLKALGKQKVEILLKCYAFLNEELFPRIRKDMFITLFMATFDTKTNKIIYARAGHEPGLLLKNNTITELRGPGMALGMVEPSLFNDLILIRKKISTRVTY